MKTMGSISYDGLLKMTILKTNLVEYLIQNIFLTVLFNNFL